MQAHQQLDYGLNTHNLSMQMHCTMHLHCAMHLHYTSSAHESTRENATYLEEENPAAWQTDCSVKLETG